MPSPFLEIGTKVSRQLGDGVEYWGRGRREQMADMWKGLKAALAVLAGIFGVPLVVGGIFVFVMAGYVIDPTIAGGGQSEAFACIGCLAASIGAFSCLAAWWLVRSATKAAVTYRSQLSLPLSSLPFVFLGIWGIEFGVNVLSAIYHDDTLCVLCIAMGTTLTLVGSGPWLYAFWRFHRDDKR